MMNGRLAEVMLYIAKHCEDDASFGSTKLNKILFMADFSAYGTWGDSLTGATYIRYDYGPIPRDRPEAENVLIQSGRIRVEERTYFGRPQKRLVAVDEPNLEFLSRENIELLDQIIALCGSLNGTQLSEWTHHLLPWLYSFRGEEIKYTSVFCMRRVQPSIEDMEWAKKTLNSLRTRGLWSLPQTT